MAETVEVALFPIPNLVAFPGHKVPLHIFEPRYRLLIKDSFREKRLVGVCHTKKVLREAKETDSLEEKLQKNQSNYEPFPVFSAGMCEIQDITDDGRLYANVDMKSRYEIIATLQEVPYKIVKCRVYEDSQDHVGDPDALQARMEIDQLLKEYSAHQDSSLSTVLEDTAWKNQSLTAYSFAIFQVLKFEPHVMQTLLEMRSALERLETVRQSLLDLKK